MGMYKKKHNKIEDKLIEYGKKAKIKREAAKYEKDKQFLDEIASQKPFKASKRISQGKEQTQPAPDKNFFERLDDYKQKKNQKVEDMKLDIKSPENQELTFKPKITKLAATVGKRTVDDLYKWKESKDKEVKRLQIEKEEKEKNEITKLINSKHKISKNSEAILKSRQINQSIIQEDQDNMSFNKEDIKLDIINESNIAHVMNDNDFTKEENLDLWPTKNRSQRNLN